MKQKDSLNLRFYMDDDGAFFCKVAMPNEFFQEIKKELKLDSLLQGFENLNGFLADLDDKDRIKFIDDFIFLL